MREGTLSFGSPVVRVTGDRAGAPEGVGIIVDRRAADCRVQYLRAGRSFWIPLRDLRLARREEIEGSIEWTVARLLEMLRAVEAEMTMIAPGRLRLAASHGAVTPDSIDAIRSYLGPRLLGCVLRPGSMHRIQTILEIEAPP